MVSRGPPETMTYHWMVVGGRSRRTVKRRGDDRRGASFAAQASESGALPTVNLVFSALPAQCLGRNRRSGANIHCAALTAGPGCRNAFVAGLRAVGRRRALRWRRYAKPVCASVADWAGVTAVAAVIRVRLHFDTASAAGSLSSRAGLANAIEWAHPQTNPCK